MNTKLGKVSFCCLLVGLVLSPQAAQATSPSRLEPFLSDLKDGAGKAITASTPGSTLIFEARQGKPVVAPDGRQLTLAEFTRVQGWVSAKCTSQGTRVAIHLTGLVPGGVYTVWLLTFGPTGPATGVGQLGVNPDGDGPGNAFVADADGEADLLATNPGGALSVRGTVGACWLTDNARAQLLGGLHLDGKTWGKVPGPAGTFVEQFAFNFRSLNHVLGQIRDGSGNRITANTPADTLVFEARQGKTVVAPDGHQLTLAEFNAPQGSVSVKCNNQGTRVALHLDGLIPDGVYTVWAVVFGPQGAAADPIGVGALGKTDFAGGNIFFADGNGEVDFSATLPAGSLSARGSVGACFLTETEVHVVGAFHMDGQAHGASPGPPGTFVEQFAFAFQK